MAEEDKLNQEIIEKLSNKIKWNPAYKSTTEAEASEFSASGFFRESSVEPADGKHIFSRSASPAEFDYEKFQVPAGSNISLSSKQMNSLLRQAAKPARGKPVAHVAKIRKLQLNNFAGFMENLFLSKQNNYKTSKSVLEFGSSVVDKLHSTTKKKKSKIQLSRVQLTRKLTQMGFGEQVEKLKQICFEHEQEEAMKNLLLDLHVRQHKDKYIQQILDDDNDPAVTAIMDFASQAAASASTSTTASRIYPTTSTPTPTGGDASASSTGFLAASAAAASAAAPQPEKTICVEKTSFVGNCDETSSAKHLVGEWITYHFRNHIPTSEEMVAQHVEHLNKCTPEELDKAIKDFEEEFFEHYEEVLDQFQGKFKVAQSDHSTDREVWKRRSLKNFGEMKDSAECKKFLLECVESCKDEHQKVFADHMCRVLAKDVKPQMFPPDKMTALHCSKPVHAIEEPCSGDYHNKYCESTGMCKFRNDRDTHIAADPSTLVLPPWTYLSFQLVNPNKKAVSREDIAGSIFMGVVYNVRMVADRVFEKNYNVYDMRYQPLYDILCMDGSTFTLPGSCMPNTDMNYFMKSPLKDSEFEDADSAMLYWNRKKSRVSQMFLKLEEIAEKLLKFDVIGSSIKNIAQKIGRDVRECTIKPVFMTLDDGPEVATWRDVAKQDYKTLPSNFFHTHKILTIHPFSRQQQPNFTSFLQSQKLSFDPPMLADFSDVSDFSKTLQDFFAFMKPFRIQLLASSPDVPSNWKRVTEHGKICWKKNSNDKEPESGDEEDDSDDSYQVSLGDKSDNDSSDENSESEIGTAGSQLMQSVAPAEPAKSSLVEQYQSQFSAEHVEKKKRSSEKVSASISASTSPAASAAAPSSSKLKDVVTHSSPKPGSAGSGDRGNVGTGSAAEAISRSDVTGTNSTGNELTHQTEPPKRKRGRPRKVDGDGNPVHPVRKRR